MQFSNIPLTQITPDANQPRKFYDAAAMEDLTASVLEKGVIQPILVRPHSNGSYLLVCGERRYKAAQAVFAQVPERNTIPAIARVLSNDEALELQIIENLQRKDVHPMEEAVAFESMLQHNMDVKTIAKKVGKSDYFIRQRIKLCNLTDDWQKIFFANRISITDVLKISAFDTDVQDEIFEEEVYNNDEKIELYEYSLNSYNGSLSKAAFDITDATLYPEVGSCINCQYNSATALLFAEDATNPVCKKISCFKYKSDINFNIKLKEAIEDPTLVFCAGVYEHVKRTKQIIVAGHEVITKYDYKRFEDLEPEKPDFKEFEEEWLEEHDKDRNGCIEAFDKAMQKYHKEVAELQKEVAQGKFVKAFIVDGIDAGRFELVKLCGKKGVGMDGNSEDEASSSIADEITRLKEKEEKFKGRDEVKIWEEIKPHFSPYNNASLLKSAITILDMEALAFAIYNKLYYESKNAFCKLFEIDIKKEDCFSNLHLDMLPQMLRFFYLDILPPKHLFSVYTHEALVSLKIARDYFPSVLKNIEAAQEEISSKRIAKVNTKIAELQKKLPAPEPAKEKKTKKASIKSLVE